MMKRVFLSLSLLTLLVVPSLARAQNAPTATYTPPSSLNSTVKFATSATSAATLTITPGSGLYLYIQQISIVNCAGAAVTGAAPLSITSTGIGGGTTPVWTVGTTSTAGVCNPVDGYSGPQPLRSNTAGTAVTIVLPTFTTNQTIRVNVWYYEAL
jgi:hypothetical protein